MSDKKTILILIGIISVATILIGILIAIYGTPKEKEEELSETDKLYYVIKGAEGGYGISKTNGTAIVETKYQKIARVNDTVYLKNEETSYIYFLNTKESISLGGKESDVYFVYDKTGILLPYFIFRYGDTEQTSIYRIFNEKGIRHASKDFASLNEAYKFLNAREIFERQSIINPEITNKYKVVNSLDYLTNEGKRQYIVTELKETKDTKGKYGIVDETGKVILSLTYDNVTPLQSSTNAVKVEEEERMYIFLVSEKLIEVEFGFEFVIEDGYLIQKRGTTVNKIYNTDGDVVVDGIYNINTDLTAFNLKSGITYMLVQEDKEVYNLYNITHNKKTDLKFTNVVLDYLGMYDTKVKNTSMLYSNKSVYYVLDLEDLKSYKVNPSFEIVSPLDLGVVYISKKY